VGELILGPHITRAVALELELPVDRAPVDQAVEVRIQVVGEAGDRDLFGGAAAAGHLTRLQHQHPLPGLGQIPGAGQPVVSPADHDYIPRLTHQL